MFAFFVVEGTSKMNNTVVISIKNSSIVEVKNEYIEMRDTFDRLDDCLSYPLLIINSLMIFTIMSYIYLLSVMYHIVKLEKIAISLFNSLTASITILIINCYICNSVHQKSGQILKALSRIQTNLLSDREYKDWLTFVQICSKTSFGFTIGGFASLRKTTLIAVIILYI